MLNYINNFMTSLKDINLILAFFFLYLLYSLSVFLWSKRHTFISTNLTYQALQRVHEDEVPRLGGFIIYLFLFLYSFFLAGELYKDQLQLTLICLLPMMVVSIKEDIFHNTDYKLRLFSITISALSLIIFSVVSFPEVNIFLFSELFKSTSFNFFFFTICLIVLANGFNFIDGMNGLLAFYVFGAVISCINLAYLSDTAHLLIYEPPILYGLLILFFLSLNFPWGRIFMGDSGAYLFAMLLGIWVINFFANNPDISEWNAVLIFLYPIMEGAFSFTRKIYQKKSPFLPDREHLHMKVYDLLNYSLKKTRLSNNLTTIFLAVFWFSPPLILPWVYDSQILLIFSILFLCCIYICLNIFIPPAQK